VIRPLTLAMLLAFPTLSEAVELDASGSIRADLWSGDRDLNGEQAVASASVWLRGKLDLGSNGALVANGWVRATTDRDRAEDARHSVALVRELFWQRDFGPATLRVGRLMPAWGRADGFNPTDNLSPRDFALLTPEDSDQRFGNNGVSMDVAIGQGTLSAHWFDNAASHRPPLEASPGVRYERRKTSNRSQWALKFETSRDGFDGSLSYFDGHSLMPDLSPAGIDGGDFVVALDNHRARVFGADVSATARDIVWRAEFAWANVDNAGSEDLFRKKSQVWLVAGGERQLLNGATVGLQLTARHVHDFEDLSGRGYDPLIELARRQSASVNQSQRNQYGLTWRIAKSMRNDALRLEMSGAALFPHDGALLRAKAEYAINDHLTFQTGFDGYFGGRLGFFGQLRKNNLIYTQLRYSFGSS
jgi:hypothetical protein